MRKVTLNTLAPTPDGTSIYKAGSTVSVPDDLAKDWEKRGMLHIGKGPTEQEQQRAKNTGSSVVPGSTGEAVFLPVTPEQYTALKAAGYDSPAKVASTTDEELLAVEGMNEATAARIREAVGYGE